MRRAVFYLVLCVLPSLSLAQAPVNASTNGLTESTAEKTLHALTRSLTWASKAKAMLSVVEEPGSRVDALNRLAYVYAASRRDDDAREALDQLAVTQADLDEEDAEYWAIAGISVRAVLNKEGPKTLKESILTIDPIEHAYLWSQASYLAIQRSQADAIVLWLPGIKTSWQQLEPEGQSPSDLITPLCLAGRYNRALSVLDKDWPVYEKAIGYTTIALWLTERGRLEKAKAVYEKAEAWMMKLRAQPIDSGWDYPPADDNWPSFAELQAALGMDQQAKRSALSSSDPMIRSAGFAAIACTYGMQQKHDQAKEVFARAWAMSFATFNTADRDWQRAWILWHAAYSGAFSDSELKGLLKQMVDPSAKLEAVLSISEGLLDRASTLSQTGSAHPKP